VNVVRTARQNGVRTRHRKINSLSGRGSRI
jgi:hypothetical protein